MDGANNVLASVVRGVRRESSGIHGIEQDFEDIEASVVSHRVIARYAESREIDDISRVVATHLARLLSLL